MKHILTLTIITLLLLNLSSCGNWMFTEVQCREFEYEGDLVWYPGEVGDTLVFVSNTEPEIRAVVEQKFITHHTMYISDTGCSCYDTWGMELSVGEDTLQYWGISNYIYDQASDQYNRIYIGMDGSSSGFAATSVVSCEDTLIGEHTYTLVRKYSREAAGNNEFITVYTAPAIGIIRLERYDGAVWDNSDLTEKDSYGIATFEYEELTCD